MKFDRLCGLVASAALCLPVLANAQLNTATDGTYAGVAVDGTVDAGSAPISYSGLNSGFGDVIGAGSTTVVDSDSTGAIQFGFASTATLAPNFIVIYLDTQAGGLADTFGILDTQDDHRKAISGTDGNSDSDVTFAVGFEADVAVAIGGGSAQMYALANGGPGSLSHLGTLSYADSGTNYEVEIPSSLLPPGSTFDYVITLISATGFRSDEWVGVGTFASGNPGAGDVVLGANDFNRFTSRKAPLPQGALAFVGMNVDGDDDVALVTLQDITDEQIFLSDNEPTGPTTMNADEGVLSWTTGAGTIPAGTVVVFTDAGSAGPSVSVGTVDVAAGDLNIGTTGDSVIAYQGDDVTTVSGYIAAIENAGGAGALGLSGLTEGTHWLNFSAGASDDGGEYSGARVGQTSFAGYLALVNDPSNWTTSAGDGESLLPFDATAFEVCGDGILQGVEACDDAGTADGDGCSATCTVEAGYDCTGAGAGSCSDIDECNPTSPCDANATCDNIPGSFTCTCNAGFQGDGTTCTTVCNDSIVAGAETCDDGNNDDGDGCTADCSAIEANFACPPAGGACDCAPGFASADCSVACAVCEAGSCNGGTAGDGTCTCDTGYEGTLCDVAVIGVTTTGDVVNGNDGLCSLREAVAAANTNTASGAAAGECIAGGTGADRVVLPAGNWRRAHR